MTRQTRSDGLDPALQKIHNQLVKGFRDRRDALGDELPWEVDPTTYEQGFADDWAEEDPRWDTDKQPDKGSFRQDDAAPATADKKAGAPPAAN
jgi:hypothetical protein